MRVSICYFSATGNTRRIVDAYAQTWTQAGWQVTLCDIERGQMPAEHDALAIAYPVHAFNAPQIVLRYARRLQSVDGKKLIIFKTSGEPLALNDISSAKLIAILRGKGYSHAGEYRYVMPYNIMFRHSDFMAHRMLKDALALARLDAVDFVGGKATSSRRIALGGLIAGVMRIEHWGSKLNGMFYHVSGDCVRCGKCVSQCPTGNIVIKDGKVRFGKHCMMCMRCSMMCPQDAVRIGLFDSWRVNGAYSFEPSEPTHYPHENFCKRAYERYFTECERRIAESQEDVRQNNMDNSCAST